MSNYYNSNPNGNSNHSLAHMNWGTIVFLYIVWWPIGLVLTILKLIDAQAEKNEEQGRANWADQLNGHSNVYGNYNTGSNAYSYRAYTGTAAPNAAAQNTAAAQYARQRANSGPATMPPVPQAGAPQPGSMPNPAAYRAPYQAGPTQEQQKAARYQRLAIAGLVVASVVAFSVGVPELLSGFGLLGYGLLNSYNILHSLLPGLLKVLAGAGLAFAAARVSRGKRREKVLATIVGSRNTVSLRELSAASGFGSKKTSQLVQDAIQHGLFGPYSYIDMATQTLVVRGAPPQAAPAKEAKPATTALKDENKYQAILRQLHEANDRIPGEEMSEKISQLETLSARIFDLAEKDPAKKPQLNKFMDYYLPTALKLLNTYATLDQQGMQGQNISDTKASIEHAMDLLVKAFEAQLDKLFQNDALDVSGDVAALQSMMSMDGLTDTDFNTAMGSPALDLPGEASPKKGSET
ncbi:MAG: 5-bromo-4-chloroindolyl phosphate hydrolysis family protein [Faecalibacterium sp.]|jgi:hypothetical protein|nr:5-bromo-4-chloroindolyl phosphate hydrolysis family protein [Faecalibacterium sp.]